MGRTDSKALGYAPLDLDAEFDPLLDDFVSKDRKYLHFDRALSEAARESVRATDDILRKNAFWPLLGFTKTERRARRDQNGDLSFVNKDREIKFGSHSDAALMEAYARRLAHPYERLLKEWQLDHCVLAYRRSCGNNISQAKILFDEIRARESCTAIGLDIRSFFDKISHDVLADNLKLTLGVSRLDLSDFKLYKRMTSFEWVDADKLMDALAGIRRPHGRICDAKQFREIVRTGSDLILTNPHRFGIPQGTPLSGLYANISLLSFDRCINDYIRSIGGVYKRYSDDIALVIPHDVDPVDALTRIEGELSGMGLSVAENKTITSKFSRHNSKLVTDKEFQYLGFTFDGNRTLIRQSSLNRYYAKMSRGIKSKVRAARKEGVSRDTMYMRYLFKRYTHFGKYRNFPRYAYRAADVFKSRDIRKQLRNHMKIFKRSVKYYLDRAY